MRGLLAAGAVVGVLAVGGLPALALTLAADESGSASSTAATAGERAADSRDQAGAERPGPPPWAAGKARGHDKSWKAEKHTDRGPDGDAGDRDSGGPAADGRPARKGPPPGWAVRDWARCLPGADRGAEASEDRGAPLAPHHRCGGKPEPPGHVKRHAGQ